MQHVKLVVSGPAILHETALREAEALARRLRTMGLVVATEEVTPLAEPEASAKKPAKSAAKKAKPKSKRS